MYPFFKVVLKVGMVVAAAFAFTILVMGLARTVPEPVNYLCGYLIWPGMAITVDWLHTPVLGDSNFFPLTLFFNTLIYSVLFGLPFVLLGILERGDKSED